MESHVVQLHPAQDMDHPFVQHTNIVDATLLLVTEQLSRLLDPLPWYCQVAFKEPFLYLTTAPKQKSGDAGLLL